MPQLIRKMYRVGITWFYRFACAIGAQAHISLMTRLIITKIENITIKITKSFTLFHTWHSKLALLIGTMGSSNFVLSTENRKWFIFCTPHHHKLQKWTTGLLLTNNRVCKTCDRFQESSTLLLCGHHKCIIPYLPIGNFKHWKVRMHTFFKNKSLGFGVETLLPTSKSVKNVFRVTSLRMIWRWCGMKSRLKGKKCFQEIFMFHQTMRNN